MSYSHRIVCLFIFSLYFVVYTNSIHSLEALQHYNSWNFTGIPHILAQCCLDDGHIKEHSLHIIWIHGKYRLSLITRMVIKGIRVSPHFTIACVCLDVPIVIEIIEHIVLKFPWVIQNVYTAYILGKHPLSICIQTVYTRFSFLGCLYDSHIYAFSHITSLLFQSLADACLWVVSLRRGLVHSRSLKLLAHT